MTSSPPPRKRTCLRFDIGNTASLWAPPRVLCLNLKCLKKWYPINSARCNVYIYWYRRNLNFPYNLNKALQRVRWKVCYVPTPTMNPQRSLQAQQSSSTCWVRGLLCSHSHNESSTFLTGSTKFFNVSGLRSVILPFMYVVNKLCGHCSATIYFIFVQLNSMRFESEW